MAGPCCHNCVYSVCDPDVWLHAMWAGEPVVPQCANHPRWPGQLHDVPGVPCRNFRPKPALPKGDSVRMIPLGDGFYAYVDAADYEELNKHVWHLNNGYASRREKGRRIYLHREIMRPPKGMVVDHIDGNTTNDCRFNLRVCTQTENLRNKRKRHGARSKFKGVFYCEDHRKWWARCRARGRDHWRGYFADEIEAARAYDRLATECFGIHARVNLPEEWPPERRAEVYTQRDAAKKPRTEDGRRGTGGGKRGKEKKTKGKNKRPHAETAGRKEGKRRTKARRSEGKKARASQKVTGGTSRSPKRKTRRKSAGGNRRPKTGD